MEKGLKMSNIRRTMLTAIAYILATIIIIGAIAIDSVVTGGWLQFWTD